MRLSKKIDLMIAHDFRESRRVLELYHQESWIAGVQLSIYRMTKSEEDARALDKTNARIERYGVEVGALHNRIKILQLVSYPHLKNEWRKEVGR